MIIKWLDDALHDLQMLRQYIAHENPSAAKYVANCIINRVNLLPEQPSIGRHGRISGTRELVILGTSYILPYRVKNNVIEILRVFHSAMLWPEEL